eukprot:scaffold1172_cov247-Pinguiococcus_pyrenoidosus.AAC.17
MMKPPPNTGVCHEKDQWGKWRPGQARYQQINFSASWEGLHLWKHAVSRVPPNGCLSQSPAHSPSALKSGRVWSGKRQA